ncbi:MAG: cyclic lactone autoinducer peptide [Lachnospiraceae bacterium]|nr:cyclic lactone autoinducer peptide [Lachnospiraceae bacterium]
MQKERGKGLELIEKLIRKQSGVDNMDDPPECYGWFYQPKRPVVKDCKEER